MPRRNPRGSGLCGLCRSRKHRGHHRWCRECHLAYMREWRKTHPLTGEARRKANARAYANTYQRRGKLTPKPCEVCRHPKAEKHHDDYSKPLAVRWVCRPCHLAAHRGEVVLPRQQKAA